MTAVEADPFADLRLTEWTSCGGCAAKWGAALLTDMVRDMPAGLDPSLLVGLAPFDDAAIYEMAPGVALVSTTDFFPPLVDHPSDFGAIAAANACSDVFAMGGRVAIAVNIAAFPEHFPPDAIVAIFDAAAAVVAEAGGTIAGGHTIRNPEPIFGLAVQGVVDPARVFRKGGGRPGDVLVLSKPLGTGLALAGGSADDKAAAIAGMRRLNRAASEELQSLGSAVHAATDVTGYGLAGHGWEMAERGGVQVVVDTDRAAYVSRCAGSRRARRAHRWRSAQSRLRRRPSALVGQRCRRGVVHGSADIGRLAGSHRSGRAAASLSDMWWRVGEVAAGDPAIVLR